MWSVCIGVQGPKNEGEYGQLFFLYFPQHFLKKLLDNITPIFFVKINRLGGATVARLTPVQKVACSNHVRVTVWFFAKEKGQTEDLHLKVRKQLSTHLFQFMCPFCEGLKRKLHLTRTWFEHATFWTGVRRATVAPPSLSCKVQKLRGSMANDFFLFPPTFSKKTSW